MSNGGVFDQASLESRIASMEEQTLREGFWGDPQKAEKVLVSLTRDRDRLNTWQQLWDGICELEELYQLAREEHAGDMEQDLGTSLTELQQRYDRARLLELFTGKYDKNPAFITIHAGTGGMDASDWAGMLVRMYARWAERQEFRVEVVDRTETEGGVKSATLLVGGGYAYGQLKGETGIHRLVRISPFDSNHRRHTSFSSVYVTPEVDDDIEVDIRPEDLRIDTYRASGAGGQHVNKTDSAVRITHLSTGIVVQCQNERSQFKNRTMAMKVLKSRLYDYYQETQNEERKKEMAEKHDISWGNQIRSYVFQPYTMVKDHRTNVQVGNIQACMDGDIGVFMEAYLKQQWQSVI